MPPTPQKKSSLSPSICVYGFDRLGFETPGDSQPLDGGGQLHFFNYSDSFTSQDGFDGIIVPQGIFESFESYRATFRTRTKVNCDHDRLLEKERQIRNYLQQGAWVCFLVRQMVDMVPQDRGYQDVNDTDLCKRILNSLRAYLKTPAARKAMIALAMCSNAR